MCKGSYSEVLREANPEVVKASGPGLLLPAAGLPAAGPGCAAAVAVWQP